jgi:hypothetical protein
MVGVDENAYSDYALVWLLESLVDDGDEVVCVRVLESAVKVSEKSYQDEARGILKSIQEKNVGNQAISIVLEYCVGKLHGTFQRMVSRTTTQFRPNWFGLLTRSHFLDSDVPAFNTHRGHAGPFAGGHPGAGQHAQLLLQILPPVLPRSGSRGQT